MRISRTKQNLIRTLTVLQITLLLCFAIGVSGCSKDDDNETPQTICTTNVNIDGEITVITYNEAGQIHTVIPADGDVATYIYSDELITIQTTEETTTSTLSANGLILNVRKEKRNDATTWSNQSFEYNGTEVSTEVYTNSEGFERTYTYQWENGNMVSRTSNISTNPYEYYLDEPIQELDYIRYYQTILYGAPIIYNSNLHKSSYNNVTTYFFTEDGDITSMVVTNTYSSTFSSWDFTYECK